MAPFNAVSALEGLPPTYTQVCGRDIIRDDGLMHERMLRAMGPELAWMCIRVYRTVLGLRCRSAKRLRSLWLISHVDLDGC